MTLDSDRMQLHTGTITLLAGVAGVFIMVWRLSRILYQWHCLIVVYIQCLSYMFSTFNYVGLDDFQKELFKKKKCYNELFS